MPILLVQEFRKNLLSTEPAAMEHGDDDVGQHLGGCPGRFEAASPRQVQPFVIN
jgi:hypothetical protein